MRILLLTICLLPVEVFAQHYMPMSIKTPRIGSKNRDSVHKLINSPGTLHLGTIWNPRDSTGGWKIDQIEGTWFREGRNIIIRNGIIDTTQNINIPYQRPNK